MAAWLRGPPTAAFDGHPGTPILICRPQVAWLTPAEILRPHYGAALAACIASHHPDSSSGHAGSSEAGSADCRAHGGQGERGLGDGMEESEPLRIYEIGGGTGTLACDILVRKGNERKGRRRLSFCAGGAHSCRCEFGADLACPSPAQGTQLAPAGNALPLGPANLPRSGGGASGTGMYPPRRPPHAAAPHRRRFALRRRRTGCVGTARGCTAPAITPAWRSAQRWRTGSAPQRRRTHSTRSAWTCGWGTRPSRPPGPTRAGSAASAAGLS